MVDNTTSSIDKVFVDINEDPWLSSYIGDVIYTEMCESSHIVDDPGILSKETNGGKINYYYLEAAKYALRISAGNFDGPNSEYKPVFEVHHKDAEI